MQCTTVQLVMHDDRKPLLSLQKLDIFICQCRWFCEWQALAFVALDCIDIQSGNAIELLCRKRKRNIAYLVSYVTLITQM